MIMLQKQYHPLSADGGKIRVGTQDQLVQLIPGGSDKQSSSYQHCTFQDYNMKMLNYSKELCELDSICKFPKNNQVH